MHSKIKELKDKATKTTITFGHGAYGEPEKYQTSEVDLELFASLVIAECTKAIDPADLRIPISLETERYKCIDEIQTHFS